MHRFIKLFIIAASISLSSSNMIFAQKSKARGIRRKEIKQEVEPLSTMFNDMLSATMKILVIDSVVVNKEDFIKHIPLEKNCGRLIEDYKFFNSTDRKNDTFVYVNGFGDKCYYRDSSKSAHPELISQEFIGGKWTGKRVLDELSKDFDDINYPFLMQDGITLYFSAKSKANSLGGWDIYVARFNTDSLKFYKPENIGLPFNSSGNDYYCIIDDINNLGWLVTDRRQTQDKVCIYTFVPNSERWTDGEKEIDKDKLISLAKIMSIKDTQYDEKARKNAILRLESIKDDKLRDSHELSFIVNDNTTYHRLSDFKSETSKKLYQEYLKLKNYNEEDMKRLEALRKAFSTADATERISLSKQIMKLEKETEESFYQIKILTKKIRNTENLM